MNRRPLLVAAAGLALAAVVAAVVGKSLTDTTILIGIAGGASIVTGVVGTVALHLLRERSFVAQVTVVALTSVVAVAAGSLGAGSAMFLSTSDLDALGVVVVASAAGGVCAALMLAERVAAASRLLGESAQRLGDSGDSGAGDGRDVAGFAVGSVRAPSIREFADLAQRLEDTAARLDASRERERAADAARRELVSWVSHDLRTPLAGIRAMSEALEDGMATDAATLARYHHTLRVEADRLSALVDDLFELSRISAGAVRLQPEAVSLADVVSDALAATDALAAAKGVRLEGRMDGPAPQLRLSTPEFSRALGNLLLNAIRETPAEGTVAVEAGADSSHAWVAVSDTCGGIPDEDLPRLFDTAFRGSRARTPSSDAGAGLGLAIAKGLVEAHAGEISVSNAGAGCRFVVRVPLDVAA